MGEQVVKSKVLCVHEANRDRRTMCESGYCLRMALVPFSLHPLQLHRHSHTTATESQEASLDKVHCVEGELMEIAEKLKGKEGMEARLPEYTMTSWAPFIRLEYRKGERTVRCQKCKTLIPKDIPRFYWYGHYRGKGHLCMECAKEKLSYKVSEFEEQMVEMENYIRAYKRLMEVADEVANTEEYKKFKVVGGLLCRIG